ncbi:kinase-like (PK-like) [Fusarium albosuccineum]|uniref:Kinase-like (PK-like) n=1 Tax=Fusarium albosuccineum TaxID=1237068 RepID=A0A8H4PF66_9HYPO|nr:kinase-like (PK-like) [Fusarium albosuccineum]
MGDRGTIPRVTISDSDNHANGEISAAFPVVELNYTYEGNGLLPINDNGGRASLDSLLRDYYIEGEDGEYWTLRLLHHIATRSRVKAELQRHRFGSEKLDNLLDKVCPQGNVTKTKSYLRIFVLLVLVEKVECLPDFVDTKRGICDDDLPVVFRRDLRGRPLCPEKKRSKCLDCFTKWKIKDRELFETNQWKVLVPFFDVTKQNSCKEFGVHPKSCRPWRRNSEQSGGNIDPLNSTGAYGTVIRVDFHPTCHSFQEVLTEINLNETGFAIKTLHEADFNDDIQFRRELDQLRRFSGLVHRHLVTTLGAFKRDGKCNFIFPRARWDLDHHMDYQSPTWDLSTVLWASEQFMGLMGALDTIHNPKHLHLSDDPEKRYGRHGDIKCDNILCFQIAGHSGQHNLVISDFGLSAYNRDTSRSNIPNKGLPAVPGYRPPECDIEGGLISRAYDIWTMGCLFLEILTWLLGGPKLLQDFREKRQTPYINGANNDIFFVLKTFGKKGYVAQVKPEVTRWIQRLRSLNNCSRFAHDVLDLIQTEMLVVLEDSESKSSSGKRTPSGELKAKFRNINRNCRGLKKTYCTQGAPVKDEEPWSTPAVEASLNEFATKMILDHQPPLGNHRGGAKRSMLPKQFEEMDKVPNFTVG